jgi:hypothetical protein
MPHQDKEQRLSHSRAQSLGVLRTFIGLICSQFELIKIKFPNYNCLLFLGAYKFYVMENFSKIVPPFRVAQANPVAAQKPPMKSISSSSWQYVPPKRR